MSLRLQNYNEILVSQSIDEILKRQGVCNCEHCKMDIMAIALNKLHPHYIVTERGELFAKINNMVSQSMIDVTTEIVAAAEFVKNHPRHGE